MKRYKIATILLSGMLSKIKIQDVKSDVERAFKYADELIKQAGEEEKKLLDEKKAKQEEMMTMCNSCKKYEMCRTFDVFHANCNDYEQKEGKV